MSQMTWFGTSWDAPINEECERLTTPTGWPCSQCREPIESWASGVVMPHITLEGATLKPQHLECFVRSTVGSVGHQKRRCSCYGGSEDDPPELTSREAARLAAWYCTATSLTNDGS